MQIKINLFFINNNYPTVFLLITESFQHDNVFATLKKRKRFFAVIIYINLTFEVNYKQKHKAKLT